jgi:hypothetical protein
MRAFLCLKFGANRKAGLIPSRSGTARARGYVSAVTGRSCIQPHNRISTLNINIKSITINVGMGDTALIALIVVILLLI